MSDINRLPEIRSKSSHKTIPNIYTHFSSHSTHIEDPKRKRKKSFDSSSTEISTT